MAITGSVFSLKDVVNVFDEDIRPSSLAQARTLTLSPVRKTTLSSFSGSDNPFILSSIVVSSDNTGSSIISTITSTNDDGQAVVQYRKISQPDTLFTSSVIELSPSSSIVLVDLPQVTGSFEDYEYRVVAYNGYNNLPGLFSTWQETGSSYVVEPVVSISGFTPISSSAYFNPNLYTGFVETNSNNLDLRELEVYISLYHVCDKFNIPGKKKDFEKLSTNVYIPKNTSFDNAEYFIISSSLSGLLSGNEIEIKLGVGYYVKEKNDSSNNLRYVNCFFQPKSNGTDAQKYIILEPKSSTFNCNDSRIREISAVSNINKTKIFNSFTTFNSPTSVIFDEINSRVDSYSSVLPEFPSVDVKDINSNFISIPTSSLTFTTIPPIDFREKDTAGYLVRFLVSGSFNPTGNICTEIGKTVAFGGPNSTTFAGAVEVGLFNEANNKLKSVSFHRDSFGSGKRFNNSLLPPLKGSENGAKIFNYTYNSSTFFNSFYSYLALNYPVEVAEGYVYLYDILPPSGVIETGTLADFCAPSRYRDNGILLAFDVAPPNTTKVVRCGTCSDLDKFSPNIDVKKERLFLGMYTLYSNTGRTEGMIVDGQTENARCVSSSAYTVDPYGGIEVSYRGSFCTATNFTYDKNQVKKELLNRSVYVLQSGSFIDNNTKENAKLVFVQNIENQRLEVIGTCGTCKNPPLHPFPAENFRSLYGTRFTNVVNRDLKDNPYASQIQVIHSGSSADCCRQVEEVEQEEDTSVNINSISSTTPRYVP